jgi:hypothetical protein
MPELCLEGLFLRASGRCGIGFYTWEVPRLLKEERGTWRHRLSYFKR